MGLERLQIIAMSNPTQMTNSQIASIDANKRAIAAIRFLNARFESVEILDEVDDTDFDVPHAGMVVHPYNQDMLYIRLSSDYEQQDVIDALDDYDDIKLHNRHNEEEISLKYRCGYDGAEYTSNKITGAQVADNRIINSLIIRSKMIDIKGITGSVPNQISTYDDSKLYDAVAAQLAEKRGNDAATKIKFGDETYYYTREIRSIKEFSWSSDYITVE